MKKLLLRLFLLALPFAAYMVAFEVRYGGECNNLYIAKRRLLEERAATVETLVLGSSHTYHGILPEALGTHAFNLAAPAQSLYYDVELARRYLPRLPRLETVVVPVSYFSLGTQLDEFDEERRCYYYRRFLGIPHRRMMMELHPRNFSLYLILGRRGHRTLTRDAREDYDRSGGLLQDAPAASASELERTATSAIRHHHSFMRQSHVPENLASLVELAGWLRERGVRLMLVTLPVSAGYRARMRPADHEQMQSALREFCAREGATYRNYEADERFGPEAFLDGDHLNRRGAVLFSTILGADLKAAGPSRPPGITPPAR